MADVLDPVSMIGAAEQAAAAGDYPEAERLLREAAARQEADLGSRHPDLATTLNNLAFVCERLNKYDDAERGYRRAHAIAVASLSPGHPVIATSLKNLVDFCAAHEIPIWKPPAARSSDESDSLTLSLEPKPHITEPRVDAAPDVRGELVGSSNRSPSRTIAAAVLGVAAIVVLAFAMQGRGAYSPSHPSPPTETTPAVTREPEPEVMKREPPFAVETRPATPSAPVEPPQPREASVTSASVTVLSAQLCSALEKRGSPDWQCAVADGDLKPGTYMFYTRLLTNAATAVEHRWYRDGRIHQAMKLRVAPAAGGGYRTFSINTVSPERAGEWKVELRSADGSVLHEQQFVVR